MDRYEREKEQQRRDAKEKRLEETMDEIRLDNKLKQEYNKGK